MDMRMFVDALTLSEMNELALIIHDKRMHYAVMNRQPLHDDEKLLIQHGYWIDAIKQYRRRFNCSLLEAKVAIDSAR